MAVYDREAGTPLTARERRTIMLEQIRQAGWLGFNRSEFARKYGVSAELANRDYHKLMSKIPEKDLQIMQTGIFRTYEGAIEKALKILNSDVSPDTQLKAINTINAVNKGWIEFLEAYNLKEKPEEKLKIEGEWKPDLAIMKKALQDLKKKSRKH